MKLERPNERLRAARIAAGFATARGFADFAEIDYGSYAHHERGSRGIKAEKADLYASHLMKSLPQLTSSWILWGFGNLPFDIDTDTSRLITVPRPGEIVMQEETLTRYNAVFQSIQVVKADDEMKILFFNDGERETIWKLNREQCTHLADLLRPEES